MMTRKASSAEIISNYGISRQWSLLTNYANLHSDNRGLSHIWRAQILEFKELYSNELGGKQLNMLYEDMFYVSGIYFEMAAIGGLCPLLELKSAVPFPFLTGTASFLRKIKQMICSNSEKLKL